MDLSTFSIPSSLKRDEIYTFIDGLYVAAVMIVFFNLLVI